MTHDRSHRLRPVYPLTAELKLHVIPHRPGRAEPRAVKRRPKEYNRLNPTAADAA